MQAEARALITGLDLASQLGIPLSCMELDAQVLLHFIHTGSLELGIFDAIMQVSLISFMQSFPHLARREQSSRFAGILCSRS